MVLSRSGDDRVPCLVMGPDETGAEDALSCLPRTRDGVIVAACGALTSRLFSAELLSVQPTAPDKPRRS